MGVARKIEVVEPVRAKRLPLSLSLLHGGQHGAANADAEGVRPQTFTPERASIRRKLDASALNDAISRSGLSNEQIGRHWGIPYQHVADVRNGDRPLEWAYLRLSPPTLKRLLQPYFVSILSEVTER